MTLLTEAGKVYSIQFHLHRAGSQQQFSEGALYFNQALGASVEEEVPFKTSTRPRQGYGHQG